MENDRIKTLIIRDIEKYVDNLAKYNQQLHTKYMDKENFNQRGLERAYDDHLYYLHRIKEKKKTYNYNNLNNILKCIDKVSIVYASADVYDEDSKQKIIDIIEEIIELKENL